MKFKILFALACLGILAGVYSAYVYGRRPPAQRPVFNPAANPYPEGIYATGILESYQSHGENINIFPEVAGPITRILHAEGDVVQKGDPLLTIDCSVQAATAEQQRMQAEAAMALLQELKAQPRPENLDIAKAEVARAQAAVKNVEDHLAKQERAATLSSELVSPEELDNSRNAVRIAEASLAVAQRQFELTRAGAWSYDVKNQESQYAALYQAYLASKALLDKYTVRAPVDGVVLAIGAAPGSYVSPQGTYNTYTGGARPLIVMGTPQDRLEVRCYVDEILVHRLPDPARISAKMFVRGTNVNLPITFERLQPYVSPKIELADQHQERVDVRVLPVIFRLDKPQGLNLFPGQLVDVYIGQQN
jgi:HlyD family secretion protein